MMRRQGFTLLETLLTLALLLVIVGMSIAFSQEARQARAAVVAEVETVAAARMIMDRLTAELRVAVSVAGQGFDGSGESLRFAAAGLPPPTVWSTGDSLSEPQPAPVQDVRVISYRLVYDESDVQPLPAGIRRSVETLLPAALVEEGDTGSSTFLGPHLRFLAYRYWDGSQWVESWQNQGLPLAVEIRLGVEPLPEDTQPLDYPFEHYCRVVALPAGAAPDPQETGDLEADLSGAPVYGELEP